MCILGAIGGAIGGVSAYSAAAQAGVGGWALVGATASGAAVGALGALLPTSYGALAAVGVGGLAGAFGNVVGQEFANPLGPVDLEQAALQGGLGAAAGLLGYAGGLAGALDALGQGAGAEAAIDSGGLFGGLLAGNGTLIPNFFIRNEWGGLYPDEGFEFEFFNGSGKDRTCSANRRH